MNKTKYVKINGARIPILIKNRALVEYKRLTGRNTVDDIEDSLQMMYQGLIAGAKSVGFEFKMSFEDFIDYTDAHPEDFPKDEDEDEPEDFHLDKKKEITT